MKYNQGGFKPPEKKVKKIMIVSIFSYILIMVIILFVLGIFVYCKYFKIDINTIVSVLAVFISLSTILFSLIEKTYDKYFSTKKSIDISVDVNKDIVICWGSIENSGRRRIFNKNVYLVLCKGKNIGDRYVFGFSLEHEDDNGVPSFKEEYCIYSKLMHMCNIEKCFECRDNKEFLINRHIYDTQMKQLINRYNRKINTEEYHKIFVFDGLSKEARLYVDPGEQFSDELVVKLKPGIYRAMIIWIPEGNEDCACAVKYFNIA